MTVALSPADVRRVLAEFRPGRRIWLQAGVTEPLVLRTLLAAHPDALDGVELVACLLPGMNDFDYAALHPGARLTTFLLPPALRPSFESGRVTVRPLPYSQIAAHLAAETFDLAILQVAPPGPDGRCSFGPCADFGPIVAPRAARRLAFFNHSLPAAAAGPALPREAIDLDIAAEGPFLTGEDAAPSGALAAIAQAIAGLVPDGAAIQSGIGGAPAAVIARLAERRGLVVRSGMVTEGYRSLARAGALDPAARHVTGLAYGDERFVRWACETLAFADARTTHGAAALAEAPRLHAINSALEVDLFGQANLEWRGGRLASGLGGAPDFARAARRSEGGRAILAVTATFGREQASRIVPRLQAPTVSVPRDDTDLVVTEHGVADLRGTSLDERAARLIAVAAPERRAGLQDAWETLRRAM